MVRTRTGGPSPSTRPVRARTEAAAVAAAMAAADAAGAATAAADAATKRGPKHARLFRHKSAKGVLAHSSSLSKLDVFLDLAQLSFHNDEAIVKRRHGPFL